MSVSVHAPVERAYCPHCGEDLGPAQNEGVTVRCRRHGWVVPISEDELKGVE